MMSEQACQFRFSQEATFVNKLSLTRSDNGWQSSLTMKSEIWKIVEKRQPEPSYSKAD